MEGAGRQQGGKGEGRATKSVWLAGMLVPGELLRRRWRENKGEAY